MAGREVLFSGNIVPSAGCARILPGRRAELQCQDCIARLAALNKELKKKDAWRCTCKNRQHSYSNEKCTLCPKTAAEKRCPGNNLEITEEDLAFRERMAKRQKQ